jgi:excisionase family DNA binding protein
MMKKRMAIQPTRADTWAAQRLLGRFKRWRLVPGVRVKLMVGMEKKPGRAVPLPRGVQRVMVRALMEFRRGRGVVVLGSERKLTTGEAAKLLGVSRPFVVKEILAGRLKGEMVGKHRRVSEEAVEEWRKRV